jgi:hypothetical protein
MIQVPVPEHPPPVHPEKFAPVAVRVTTVPLLEEAEQELPQLIPAGTEVTVPAPATTTESFGKSNVAVTTELALMTKLQVVAVPAEAQAPNHPLNSEDVPGVATIVSAVPDG